MILLLLIIIILYYHYVIKPFYYNYTFLKLKNVLKSRTSVRRYGVITQSACVYGCKQHSVFTWIRKWPRNCSGSSVPAKVMVCGRQSGSGRGSWCTSPSRWRTACPTSRAEMSATSASHGETGRILLEDVFIYLASECMFSANLCRKLYILFTFLKKTTCVTYTW